MTKPLLTEAQKIERGGIANRRFKTTVVACTPGEWEAIARAADQAQRPLSAWLRDTGLAAARAQAAQRVSS